eukprot:12907238-Prorocentrum_lima.AAC.1
MQGTGTSVSQLPRTEALPRLDMGAPGLVPAGLIPRQTYSPAASSSSWMASSSAAASRSSKSKPTAAEGAEAHANSIKSWAALRAFEKRSPAFSWWPGQESEVYHTQTRLAGNLE